MENFKKGEMMDWENGGCEMIKKFKVRIEGKEYEVEVEEMRGEEKSVRVGRVVESAGEKKTSIKEKEPYGGFETISSKEKSVLAPMPAKVVKVNCKAGERVKKGDMLIILEAMKMENEVLSPVDGAIKEVRVKEGASVSHEETMIVFE